MSSGRWHCPASRDRWRRGRRFGGGYGSHTRTTTRRAAFQRLWHDEYRPITATASQLGLSRSHIAKTIQHPALLLVSQRAMALMQRTDPTSQSEGVQHVKRHA